MMLLTFSTMMPYWTEPALMLRRAHAIVAQICRLHKLAPLSDRLAQKLRALVESVRTVTHKTTLVLVARCHRVRAHELARITRRTR